MPKNRRRFKNFILDPLIQTQIGLASNLLALFLSISCYLVFRQNMQDFWEVVQTLTGKDTPLLATYQEYVSTSNLLFSALLGIFLISNLVISVIYSHRLVGPITAFRRHIRQLRQGDYSQKVQLRQADAFKDLARELNLFTDELNIKTNTPEEGQYDN